MRFVAFDVETPNYQNDSMSAIGITVIDDGVITDDFYTLVNPEASFDEFNIALTGIDESKVKNAPTFPQVWSVIEPMMSSGILVAHNAQFDLGVLKSCLTRYRIKWKSEAQYLCTVLMGRSLLPGIHHKLNDLCDYYDIELDHHKADSDSHACAEILLRYMKSGVDLNRHLKTYNFD